MSEKLEIIKELFRERLIELKDDGYQVDDFD